MSKFVRNKTIKYIFGGIASQGAREGGEAPAPSRQGRPEGGVGGGARTVRARPPAEAPAGRTAVRRLPPRWNPVVGCVCRGPQ